jgi:hypothetical protein
VSRQRWIFISSYEEEETRIGTKYDINIEYGSQAKEGTNVKLGSQDKRFSSNLTLFT